MGTEAPRGIHAPGSTSWHHDEARYGWETMLRRPILPGLVLLEIPISPMSGMPVTSEYTVRKFQWFLP